MRKIPDLIGRTSTKVVASIGSLGAVIGIFVNLGPVAAIIVIQCIIIAVLASFLIRKQNSSEISINKTNEIISKLVILLPEAGFLAEFLTTTILEPATLSTVRGFDQNHHLNVYLKRFTLRGADISTHEEYSGVNVNSLPSSGLRLVTFGGSSIAREEVSGDIHQIATGGTKQSLNLQLEKDGERLKVYLARFHDPIPPGGSFVVHYEEHWPRAMHMGIDAVFLTQVLYYARGIDTLGCDIEFDVPVLHIGAYWYDLDTNECDIDSQQPVLLPGAGHRYRWSRVDPPPSRLYFIMFDRGGSTPSGFP